MPATDIIIVIDDVEISSEFHLTKFEKQPHIQEEPVAKAPVVGHDLQDVSVSKFW